LARHHPTVVFELCPYMLEERGESPTALTRLFADHGYTLYDERTFSPLPDRHEMCFATSPEGAA
jgi:hypothetical protein